MDPSKTIKVKKGESLIYEGTKGDTLYWLKDGSLEVYKRCNNYRKHIGDIFPGELVGEMSFLDDEARSATIVAKVDCELYEIPGEKLKEIMQKQPPWFQALIKTLLSRLRRADNALAHYKDEE